MQPTVPDAWTIVNLDMAIATTTGTVVMVIASVITRIPRRSWWAFLAPPVTAAWSWTAFVAAHLGVGLFPTIVLAVMVACAALAGWWWLSHHR